MPLRAIALFAFLSLFGQGSSAEPPRVPDVVAPGSGDTLPSSAPSLQERLVGILDKIKTADSERIALRRRLKTDASEPEVQGDLKRVERRLVELRASFAELAAGGATVEALEQAREQKAFDLQAELEEVIRPLLEELKRMTERPRTIERLRSEKLLYQERLEVADRAIAKIGENLAKTDATRIQDALKSLDKEWQSHRADAESRLQLIDTQLQHLLDPEEEGPGLTDLVRGFLAGRGLNILLAVGAFSLTYVVLAGVGRLSGRLWQRQHGHVAKTRRLTKVGAIVFRVLSSLLALLAAMLVLSVRGDWLILGLLILFLFGAALALRTSLPRYIQELRILLNMGGVREGERVVYQGIPWRIKSLNLFCTLHNPLLRGGIIRVPVSEMAQLQSRQYVKEEPWFPSREDDFVMLEGEVFGRVLLQTPEVVELQVVGATKIYPVQDYVAQRPRNLSLEGFAVPVTVGLDYRHQGQILSPIVGQLRTHIEERLVGQAFEGHLKDLIVDFNEATNSSLNILIVAIFHGDGAEHYWSIRRFLQRTAVEACNRYGWTIPFEQLTVHWQGAGDTQKAPPGWLPAGA
ncbi:MAG: hypothetical protein ACFCVA_18265 [Gammaproteobacteria bacterium]